MAQPEQLKEDRMPTAPRPFQVPEVFAMIYANLPRNELLAALTINSIFFHNAVDIIWGHLIGVEKLFTLLLDEPLPSLELNPDGTHPSVSLLICVLSQRAHITSVVYSVPLPDVHLPRQVGTL